MMAGGAQKPQARHALFAAGATARSASDHVVQGEQRVTGDPDAVLSTLLGSCVSACLWDAVAKVGGMNHFLLPGDFNPYGAGERLGVHAMELLINQLLIAGASRKRLQAKVFGGAHVNAGLSEIGPANASFACRFLEREAIPIVARCLNGDRGRRIQFWPVSGRARRSFLMASDLVGRSVPIAAAPTEAGALELF